MGIERKKLIITISGFFLFCLASFVFFASGPAYSHSEKRDLFRPLVDSHGRILITRDIDIKGMSLEGIIYTREDPVAIINSEVLRQADQIGEYVVLKIEREKVILKKEGKEYNLKLEVE